MLESNDNILKLIRDISGSHIILKILETKEAFYKDKIIEIIQSNIIKISTNIYGSKMIQRAMDFLPFNYRQALSKSMLCLSVNIIRDLLKDTHANRVVQKMIEKGFVDEIVFKKKQLGFIHEFQSMMILLSNLFSAIEMIGITVLSKDSLGCRIVNKLIECMPENLLTSTLYSPLISNALDLARDKYGNYVIQHILVHCSIKYSNCILQIAVDNIFDMSKRQSSSHFVQRCFDIESYNVKLVDAILDLSDKQIIHLMNDPFGN